MAEVSSGCWCGSGRGLERRGTSWDVMRQKRKRNDVKLLLTVANQLSRSLSTKQQQSTRRAIKSFTRTSLTARTGSITSNLNNGSAYEKSTLVVMRSTPTPTPMPPSVSSIEEIDEEFGIPGAVSFVEDFDGMHAVFLTHNNGGSVKVQLNGARIASWKQDSGDEITFTPKATDDFMPGLSLPAGGIMPIFPQYGTGKLPMHGFSLRMPWKVLMSSADVNPDDPEPSVTLVLKDSEATRAMWPHAFTATFEITLMSANRLKMRLSVRNDSTAGGELTTNEFETNNGDLRFCAAILGDFEVLDLSKPRVRVLGVMGCDGLDLNETGRPKVIAEDRDQVCLMHGPVHNLYVSKSEHMLVEVGTGATIRLQKSPEFREWFVRNHITNSDILKAATSSRSPVELSSTASDAPLVDHVELQRKASQSILIDESGDIGGEDMAEWKKHMSAGVGRCVSPVTLSAGDDWSAEWIVAIEDWQYSGATPDIGTGCALQAQPTPLSGIPDRFYFKMNPDKE